MLLPLLLSSPDGDAILQGALTYVNDNFGDWRSEKEALMGRCLEAKGSQFVRPLLPDREDYFVLKPMHSAFYMTP